MTDAAAADPRVGTMTEDYVKVIWKAHEWSGEGTTTNELAATLGVAPSSVSGNLKKLAREGYIHYEPYGRASLTPSGEALAARIVRKHRLIESWLVEHHGYTWDEVHDEAEVLEHAVSDRLLASIDDALGHPVHDPHGDPIPRPDGTVVRTPARRLSECGEAWAGAVVRVSDHDPALLRYLAELSISVGTRVRVDARREFAGSLAVSVLDGSSQVVATADLASPTVDAVWVADDPAVHSASGVA